MKTNERIRHLRKDVLHMNQKDFGKEIKLSGSNVGNIEVGRVGITERVIEDICSAFNVNEDWLLNGTGGNDNIFANVKESEKAYGRFGYIMENSTTSKKAALSMLLELLYTVPDDKWDSIMEQFNKTKDSIEKEG